MNRMHIRIIVKNTHLRQRFDLHRIPSQFSFKFSATTDIQIKLVIAILDY